jgi:signal transduction histidine kinase/ActR/RegA family two-component response regulator
LPRQDPARADQANPAFRRKAEELAREKAARSPQNIDALPAGEIRRMLYELQVHQIQLEMQNEELRRTQEELNAARARYFDLYDLAPVGYVTLSGKGEILEANLTASTLLGTARGALVLQPITRFILRDDQDTYYLHRKLLLETGESQVCELRMVKNNGMTFWARLEAATAQRPSTGSAQALPHGPIQADFKDAPACRVILSDITERKQAADEHLKFEQLNQKSQKLESLGLLAGGIAHDFNNLLGGIFGYIEIAKVSTKEKKVISCLAKALGTIYRARGLTHQLLTFSKGGTPVRKAGQLFPFAREIALSALSNKNVSCSFNIPEDLWSSNFDGDQIGQVIENIIINAQQAMPGGGAILVSAGNITLEEKNRIALPAGDYVKISFKDAGIGIPEQVLPRIFDPFFTTKDMGRGLGLATCHSIVSQHGGCIDVESEPGKGSAFHVYLPAVKQTAASSILEAAPRYNGAGTILVMDDEEILRETIGNMLDFFGYNVVCKENGREAIDFFSNDFKTDRKIVGMIFDLTVVGGMGGKDAVTEVRKLDPEIPVFVSSGYADDPVMAYPERYGFTDSICKPFTINEIIELLNRYLKNDS